MSYNILKWKTKKIENFQIPLSAFYESERIDWHPSETIIEPDGDRIMLECGCGQEIKGILKDGVLAIDEIDMSGEGSGSFMHYVMDHAFKQSTGELEATAVWEDGEVTHYIIKDGVTTEENVDL